MVQLLIVLGNSICLGEIIYTSLNDVAIVNDYKLLSWVLYPIIYQEKTEKNSAIVDNSG